MLATLAYVVCELFQGSGLPQSRCLLASSLCHLKIACVSMISTTGGVVASFYHYHATLPLTLGLFVSAQVYIFIIIKLVLVATYFEIGIFCASLGQNRPGRILSRMWAGVAYDCLEPPRL
jgi:hypothetical protein